MQEVERMSDGTDGGSAFNVKDAMGRLMNNKKLYEKLLKRFEAEYGDFYEKLKGAVDGENFEDAVHLAHTMKGLAGNLGAESLNAVSLEVETICKSGKATPELAPALERFSIELNRALDAVRAGVNMD
jgi:HPt (histidine-containing phosphotransfer) domain-containing protein